MNLQDCLDLLRSDYLGDRSSRTSGDLDVLWSDATLVRYIDEAQRRFAVKGLVIRDSTTAAVVNVTLVAGTTQYTLHPSIIAVISAKVSTAQADLVRVGHSALGSYTNPSTVFWDTSFDTIAPGAPLAYSTDEQIATAADLTVSAVSLRIYPEPDATAAGTLIKLRVVRKPLNALVTTNMAAVPEIPVDHHLEMLDYAAFLALRIVDQDAGNPKRAEEFLAMFESNVAEARKLVMRKLFTPQGWGFGRAGFSWCP